MASVVIGLGTNVGDRFDNLLRALTLLRAHVGVLSAVSRIYRSAPVGYMQQPDFWNAVAIIDSALTPMQLFRRAQAIELEVGRVRTFSGGPRVIDLDVILYDDVVALSPELAIPHPRMHERAFVLLPLAELEPDRLHPVLERTVRELAGNVLDQDAVPLEADSRALRERLDHDAESQDD
jgi:2-amino-4-hydroxy-6-hydroxymethyldihydropteridine diphosphokinase